MAFPRKNTRSLSVDGTAYLWHLNKDWDVHTRWLVVQREDCSGGQLLMLDPYHHDFLPSQGAVSQAVRFALRHGWHPQARGTPLRLCFAGRGHGFRLAASEPNPEGCIAAERAGLSGECTTDKLARGASNYTPS